MSSTPFHCAGCGTFELFYGMFYVEQFWAGSFGETVKRIWWMWFVLLEVDLQII